MEKWKCSSQLLSFSTVCQLFLFASGETTQNPLGSWPDYTPLGVEVGIPGCPSRRLYRVSYHTCQLQAAGQCDTRGKTKFVPTLNWISASPWPHWGEESGAMTTLGGGEWRYRRTTRDLRARLVLVVGVESLQGRGDWVGGGTLWHEKLALSLLGMEPWPLVLWSMGHPPFEIFNIEYLDYKIATNNNIVMQSHIL
jgi:hypothetical protein